MNTTPPTGETRGARPRLLAARAVSEVLERGRSLPDALAGLDQRLPDGRDRALVRRLCNRLLRDLPALQWRLEQLLERPLPARARIVHYLLLAAIDQMREGREPGAAIVHATVAATRKAGHPRLTGLVNAVLRNHQRRSAKLDAAMPDDPVLVHGHPGWLIDRIRHDWPEHWQAICEAGNRPPPVWLRVNRRISSIRDVQAALARAGHPADPQPGLPEALKLGQRARISTLPGFDQGAFSVQDAGAQWAVELLELEDGQRVLDACAAPGGKAAHILERAEVDLTALDADARRAERITRTFARLGLNGRVVVGDARRPETWARDRRFDRILVDAPCSASGVLRRHPDMRWLRRASDIAANAALQDEILDAVWPLLEPGGLLVYATCSILHAENRDRARSFIERHANARVEDFPITESLEVDPGRQILPGSLDRDGFYYLRLRRLQSAGG